MQAPSALHHDGRNPAIELYRVLLMFLIVLHHAAYHGYWNHAQGLDSAYPSIFLLFTALTIWHVDGFLSITGWFGTRFSFGRLAKLWGVVTVYSIVSIAHGWWANGRLSSSYLAGGWFGCTYLFFMFLTPILNAALEFISRDKRRLYLSWIILDCGAFLNWAPYHLLSNVCGSGAGAFSIMTFIIMYLNVRLLKMSGLWERVSKRMIVLATGMFLGGIMFFAFLRLSGKMLVRGADWSWYDFISDLWWFGCYNAPHVMLMAIAMLLLFAKFVKVPQWLSRIVIRIAPLMFGVYIIHDTTTFGRQIYRLPQEWMAANLGWHPLAIIFTTAIGCFVVCIVIECVRRWATAPFVRWVMPKVRLVDEKLGLC